MSNATTLDNVLALPDIVDSFRSNFMIPSLPGGGKATSLSMLNVGLSLPQMRIGHIRVPLFTHVVAFRGHRDHGNTFNISFYETSMGEVQSAIFAWMEKISHSGDDTSLRKNGYAVPARFEALDSTGAVAYAFHLTNVWPQSITPPPDSESSGPARVEVTFSVDFIDLVLVGAGSAQMRGIRALARSRGIELPTGSFAFDEDNPFLSEFRAISDPNVYGGNESPNGLVPQNSRTDRLNRGFRIDVKMQELGLILGGGSR